MNKEDKKIFFRDLKIIKEVKGFLGKWEFVKYMIKKLFGIHSNFSREVFIQSKEYVLNCGKIKENCTIASSVFEPEVSEELDLKEGTFIDVGAHIGKHTIALSKKLGNKGKVISVEADIANSKLLKENIKINKCNNVKVFSLICSDKKGEMNFYYDNKHPATNSIMKEKGKTKIKSPTNTLDNLSKNYQKIKLIKIDVESAELMVLKGATKIIRKYHPKIIFEAGGRKYLLGIKRFIEPFGYNVRRIGGNNYVAEMKS